MTLAVSIENRPERAENEEPYPVSGFYKVREGHTISKTDTKWEAILVVEADGKRQVRYYRWEKRKGQWKVGLSRFSLNYDLNQLAQKVQQLKRKWGIKDSARVTKPSRESTLQKHTTQDDEW